MPPRSSRSSAPPDKGANPFPGSAGTQLAVLTEIARLATEDLELRPMLQRVTDALVRQFGWELVALIRVDRDHERFVCEAVTSTVPTLVVPGYSRPIGSGVVGEVAASGRAVVLDDIVDHGNFVEVLGVEVPGGEVLGSTRAELCAPIRHHGEVVAVLNLESPRPGAFAGQMALVQAIADQIAGAIASALLYEATRRRAVNLEVLSEVSRFALGGADLATILQRIATYIQGRFDLFLVAIVVADPATSQWAFRAFASRSPIALASRTAWPVEAGVVGRAFRLAEPQLVLDIAADPDYFSVHPEVVAEIAIPIRLGDRSLGVLNLESDRLDSFPEEACRLLELVSDQVAGAVQLALVNEQLSDTKRELESANQQLQSANRTLSRLSQVDPLTGVSNRRHFEEALKLEWRRLERAGRPLSLLLADVDCFKAYNDAKGHLSGDRCLQRVASVLRGGALRAGDLVARYGGEEFVMVLSGADLAGASRVAQQMRTHLAALEIPHPTSVAGPWVTMSIGIATVVPTSAFSAALLLETADRALYRAKEEGRDRVIGVEA